MLPIAILFVVLLPYTRQVCQGNVNIKGIQSGNVEIKGLSQGTSFNLVANQYIHTFSQAFQQSPSIGFGIMQTNFIASTASTFDQFNIQVTEINKTSVTFRFLHVNRVWSKVKISFWANVRPDIYVSMETADFNQLSPNKQVKKVQTKSIDSYNTAISRAFINGIDLRQSSTGIQIQLQVKVVESIHIEVEIQFGAITQLTKLWYSIIVFNPFTTPFSSYGSVISSRSFQGSKYQDIQNNIQYPQYVMFGLSTVDSKFASDYGLEVDNDMIITVKNSQQNFTFLTNYIVIGVKSNQVCEDCVGEPFMYDDMCYSQCPFSTFVYNYQFGGVACHRCSLKLKLTLNPSGTGCTCIQGYQMVQGQCVPAAVPPTPVPTPTPTPIPTPTQNESICQTINNTYWTGYGCACKVGFRTQSTPFRCIPIVIDFSCNDENAYIVNRNCLCKPGYVKNVNGKCVKDQECPPNSNFFDYRCICNQGYIQVGNTCVPKQIECGPNSYKYNGTCICNNGYSKNPFNQLCQVDRKCPDNETFVQLTNNCECLPRFYRNSTTQKCIPCQDDYIYDGEKCVPLCGIRQKYNPIKKQCQCLQGHGYVTKGVCQICDANFFLKDQYCVACPINSYPDPQFGICRCNPGFQKKIINSSQYCSSICGFNQYYNEQEKRCRCKLGYGSAGNSCLPCPPTYTPNPTTDRCQMQKKCQPGQGIIEITPFACAICELSGMFLLDGYCASCPQGKKYNNITSTCQQGCRPDQLRDNNGYCYSCQINQMIQNGRCVCKDGYSREFDGCKRENCTKGYYLIKGKCAFCVSNSQYDEKLQACYCAENYFMNAYGVCERRPETQCPNGTYKSYINNTKICVDCPDNCVQCTSGTVCTKCKNNLLNPPNCTENYCGDGNIVFPEQCDDGNKVDGDRCHNNCTLPINTNMLELVGGPVVNQKNIYFQVKTLQPFSFQSAEQVSKSFTMNFASNTQPTSYTCGPYSQTSSLTLISDFYCFVNYAQSVPQFAFFANLNFRKDDKSGFLTLGINTKDICGNGIVVAPQQCDDGNTRNGDNCSSTCKIQGNSVERGIQLFRPVIINQKYIYLSLEIERAVSYQEKQTFTIFKFVFPVDKRPVYTQCNPSEGQNNLSLIKYFDCFLPYPYDVPLADFNIDVSIMKDGFSGSLRIAISNKNNHFISRSLTR